MKKLTPDAVRKFNPTPMKPIAILKTTHIEPTSESQIPEIPYQFKALCEQIGRHAKLIEALTSKLAEVMPRENEKDKLIAHQSTPARTPLGERIADMTDVLKRQLDMMDELTCRIEL
jgi:hypothetical protein